MSRVPFLSENKLEWLKLRELVAVTLTLFVVSIMQIVWASNASAPTTKRHVTGKTNAPQSISTQAQAGAALFRANGCFDCHSIHGRGCREGVSLDNIGNRRSKAFLAEQLKNPEEHVNKNQQAFNSDPNLMPDLNLSQKEINLLVSYLQTLKESPVEASRKSATSPVRKTLPKNP
jgi:cbb3-type cytochrome oxidase cytochrome c subunit